MEIKFTFKINYAKLNDLTIYPYSYHYSGINSSMETNGEKLILSKILENNFLLRWNELANTAYPSQLCIEQVILGMDIKLL